MAYRLLARPVLVVWLPLAMVPRPTKGYTMAKQAKQAQQTKQTPTVPTGPTAPPPPVATGAVQVAIAGGAPTKQAGPAGKPYAPAGLVHIAGSAAAGLVWLAAGLAPKRAGSGTAAWHTAQLAATHGPGATPTVGAFLAALPPPGTKPQSPGADLRWALAHGMLVLVPAPAALAATQAYLALPGNAQWAGCVQLPTALAKTGS